MKQSKKSVKMGVLAKSATLTIIAFIIGFWTCSNQFLVQKKEDKIVSNLESQQSLVINFYKNIAENTKGKQIDVSESIYHGADSHIHSSLLEGKSIDINEYEFNGDTIVEKNIDMGDGVNVNVAEYYPTQDDQPTDYAPSNFATFRGYENYSFTPRYVGARVASWQEPTIIVETDYADQKYYLEYIEGLKGPSGVALTALIRFYPGVKEEMPLTLVSVVKYKAIETGPIDMNNPNDPVTKDLLDDIIPIVKSIEYGELK